MSSSTMEEPNETEASRVDTETPSELVVRPSLDALLALRTQNQAELVQRFEETFSLVRLIPWMAGSTLGTIAVGYGLWFAFFYEAVSALGAWLLFAYITVSFAYLGFTLGLLLIIRRIVRKLKEILEIALAMVKDLATELKDSTTSPETSVLFKKVMQTLIIPSIRAVIAAKLGFFHRPVSWAIEKVLSRATARLLKLVGRVLTGQGKKDRRTEPRASTRTSSALSTVGRGVDSTTSFIQTALDMGERASGRIRFFALLPLRLLFGVFFVLAFFPLAVLAWLSF